MRNVVEGDAAHLEYAKWICETKRGYDSLAAARTGAAQALARDRALVALYWYRCTACERVHLTKKRRGRPLAQQIPTVGILAGTGPVEASSAPHVDALQINELDGGP